MLSILASVVTCTGILIVTAFVLFVARTRGLSAGGRALILATWFLEIPAVFIRFFIGGLFGFILLGVFWSLLAFAAAVVLTIGYAIGAVQQDLPLYALGSSLLVGGAGLAGSVLILLASALTASLGPPVMSLLRLLGLRGGAWFDAWAMGARKPSQREMDAYLAALTIACGNRDDIQVPDRIYVLDGYEEQGFVIGRVLYLGRPLLHGSPHLIAVLAHQLGWINSASGRVVMALRALTVPPVYLLSYVLEQTAPGAVALRVAAGGGYAGAVGAWVASFLLAVASGGIGQLILYPFWVGFFRQATYEADAFARALGHRHALVAYLEHHEHFDVAVPFFFTPRPYCELRIDRLLTQTQKTGVLVPQP
jgi:hypothetical protein